MIKPKLFSRLVGLSLSLAACVAPASSQQDKSDVVRVTSRLVNVDVLVTDKRTGARIDGLKREEFEVTDNGRPVTVTHFSQGADPEHPLALLLLINTRSTTKANVPHLRTALSSALMKLRSEDEVAVIDYWYGNELVQELTRDRARVLDALSAVAERQDHPRPRPKHYGGGVSGVGQDLATSLLLGAHLVQERLPGARIGLVVIDDDLNATPGELVTDTAKQLLVSGATVSGLIKVSGWFANTLKPIGHAIDVSHYPTLHARPTENVAYYSAQTGGEIINVRGDNYSAALEQLVGDLVARYSLGFVPDVTRLDGRFHDLKVKVKVPVTLGKDRKLVIRARRGYLARNDG